MRSAEESNMRVELNLPWLRGRGCGWKKKEEEEEIETPLFSFFIHSTTSLHPSPQERLVRASITLQHIAVHTSTTNLSTSFTMHVKVVLAVLVASALAAPHNFVDRDKTVITGGVGVGADAGKGTGGGIVT